MSEKNNEKVLNRPVLEKIAKDMMNMETQDQIDAFVCQFVYITLLD